jgi:hypothetical protein
MQLVVYTDGSVKCLYGEELDLRQLGELSIHRASHVEALAAEEAWLVANRLV